MLPATQSRRAGKTEAPNVFKNRPEVAPVDAEFKSALAQEIEALGSLDKNWDSYGAPPIDPKIISAGVKFIYSLPGHLAQRPRVVPMSPGNFQLEWHRGRKILELEFETPTTIRFLQWNGDQNFSVEDTIGIDEIGRVVDLIQWFMSGTCP